MPQGEPGALGRAIAARLGGLTLEKVTTVGMRNAEANRSRILAGKSVLALRDTPLARGDAALVIAAGPSLHRQDVAGRLKASGFRGPIITSESALAYCLRHGIVPDLIITLDPFGERIVRWFGDPALTQARIDRDDYFSRQDMDPKFADQLRFNAELIELVNRYGPRIRIAVSSSAPPVLVDRLVDIGMEMFWWNPFYDDYDAPGSLTRQLHASNGLPCLNAGGNVGSACWVIAHAVLQKKKVGLLGMDLGYYADTSYAQTQYYYEILDLVGPERLDEVFVRIRNPYVGQDFFTDPAYLWYRDTFLEMAQQADCITYNCTGGGILFGEGVTVTSFDEFLAATR